MAKNRNIAMKHEKAKGQRAAAFQDVLMKEAMNATRATDQEALICAIARREDTCAIAGRVIRKVKVGVCARNIAKLQPAMMVPAVIAMHW
jgi:hypothetical protein